MNIKELTREQLEQVKQYYYMGKNESVSWGELANIDNLVSDEEIFKAFEDTIFTEDDFLSSEDK